MTEIDLTGQRVQEELTRNESVRLLASVPLGRVVFTHQALPAIRPVNHVVDDGKIIIRTHAGAAIFAAAQRRVVVAYEADQIDLERHVGWSVVVVGVARPAVDPPDGAYLVVPHPWVARPMDQLIAISTDLVTGFRLLPAPIEPAAAPGPGLARTGYSARARTSSRTISSRPGRSTYRRPDREGWGTCWMQTSSASVGWPRGTRTTWRRCCRTSTTMSCSHRR